MNRGSSGNSLPSCRRILVAPLGENIGVPGLEELFFEKLSVFGSRRE